MLPSSKTSMRFQVAFLAFAFGSVLPGSTIRKWNSSLEIYMDDASIHQSSTCGSVCRFRLCELDFYGDVVELPPGSLLVLPSQRGIVPWPWICLPSSRNNIGHVQASEVRLRDEGRGFVTLTRFKRSNVYLGPFLRKNIIFPAPLTSPRASSRKSGIALRKKLSPRQKRQIEKKCVVMPITRFDVLGRDGRLINIARGGRRSDCVSFTATSRTPRVRIELHWLNQDELGLTVKEPDSHKISKVSPWNSRTGGVYLPGLRGICGGKAFSDLSENIEWPDSASPIPGEYIITVEYVSSCRQGPVEWFLFVNINGNCNLLETDLNSFSFSREQIGSSTFVLSSSMLARETGKVDSCSEELSSIM